MQIPDVVFVGLAVGGIGLLGAMGTHWWLESRAGLRELSEALAEVVSRMFGGGRHA